MSEDRDARHETQDEEIPSLESRVLGLESHRYQVFFRTSRGGCGIEYETAKAEFLSVMARRKTQDSRLKTEEAEPSRPRIEVIKEIPSRMWMEIAVYDLSTEEMSRRAEELGYTQGITSVHEEPYRGEELHSHIEVRWAVGWLRRGDKKILLTEIYRQDEEKRLENSPDRRVFLIEKDGQIRPAKGHRYHRGVSAVDVKFMVNIAELRGDEIILDPFAGLCGILIECRNRNLKAFAADVDTVLRPGLAQFSDNRCVTADARQLPFKDNIFDVIITEPPFNTKYRQAVLDSIAELRRIVREKVILLIARDMYEEIMNCMAGSEFQLTRDFTLRRHGKLISHVLRFDR